MLVRQQVLQQIQSLTLRELDLVDSIVVELIAISNKLEMKVLDDPDLKYIHQQIKPNIFPYRMCDLPKSSLLALNFIA